MKSFSVVTDLVGSKPFAVIVTDGSETSVYGITDRGQAWAESVAGSNLTSEQLLDRLGPTHTMGSQYRLSNQSLAELSDSLGKDTVEKLSVLLQGKSGQEEKTLEADPCYTAPISSYGESKQTAIGYKAAVFMYERRRNAAEQAMMQKMAEGMDVKSIRAVFDRNLGPSGGFRCPEGTANGGMITNRFGRGCGGNIIRRIGRSFEDLGRTLEPAKPSKPKRGSAAKPGGRPRIPTVNQPPRANVGSKPALKPIVAAAKPVDAGKRKKVGKKRRSIRQRLQDAFDRLDESVLYGDGGDMSARPGIPPTNRRPNAPKPPRNRRLKKPGSGGKVRLPRVAQLAKRKKVITDNSISDKDGAAEYLEARRQLLEDKFRDVLALKPTSTLRGASIEAYIDNLPDGSRASMSFRNNTLKEYEELKVLQEWADSRSGKNPTGDFSVLNKLGEGEFDKRFVDGATAPSTPKPAPAPAPPTPQPVAPKPSAPAPKAKPDKKKKMKFSSRRPTLDPKRKKSQIPEDQKMEGYPPDADIEEYDYEKAYEQWDDLVEAVESRFGEITTAREAINAFQSLGIDAAAAISDMLGGSMGADLPPYVRGMLYGYLDCFANWPDRDKVSFNLRKGKNNGTSFTPWGLYKPSFTLSMKNETLKPPYDFMYQTAGKRLALAAVKGERDYIPKDELQKQVETLVGMSTAMHEIGHMRHEQRAFEDAYGPLAQWDMVAGKAIFQQLADEQGDRLFDPARLADFADAIVEIENQMSSFRQQAEAVRRGTFPVPSDIGAGFPEEVRRDLYAQAIDRYIDLDLEQDRQKAIRKAFDGISEPELKDRLLNGEMLVDMINTDRTALQRAANQASTMPGRNTKQFDQWKQHPPSVAAMMSTARKYRDDLSKSEINTIWGYAPKISGYAGDRSANWYQLTGLMAPLEFVAELAQFAAMGNKLPDMTPQEKAAVQKYVDWLYGPGSFAKLMKGQSLGRYIPKEN